MRNFDAEIYNFDSNIEIVNDRSSDELNAKTNLMITDYSSCVFDFAYLRKPVLYIQFDKETFFKNHSFVGEGYFDYERDGFGEVEYDMDSAVDRIIEYMKTDCELKDKYRERIDKFFEFSDNKNCERIYEHIIHSPAYKEYPVDSTGVSILEQVDITKFAQMLFEEVETTEALDTYGTIDYVTYVPERFSSGDLGLKAIWWCFKGWLNHKFKKGKNKNEFADGSKD